MQLWTHHPSDFQVDDPKLVIDQTTGQYWKDSTALGLRYREALPLLWKKVGSRNFLWCCTVRGLFVRMTEKDDLVEWELNVPDSQVLAYFDSPTWETLVRNPDEDWNGLIIPQGSVTVGKDVGALVHVPLSSSWIKCHGQLPPRYPTK